MNKQKIEKLRESHELGIISKKEYELKKKEIEEDKEEGMENEEKETVKSKLSDKILVISIIVIILLFVSIFVIISFIKEEPKSIEDYHMLNLKGELDPEMGYLYKDAFSFIEIDGFWFTQLTSPSGQRLYDMSFRYSPKDLEDFKIQGNFNDELFNEAKGYYVTFNPNGSDFSHIALAVADFNQHMLNVIGKEPIAACDRNVTGVCEGRPIIDCDNTNKVVLYMVESNNSIVKYDDNCIIVEGSGFDFVKGVDRVLYNFYDIMEK